MCHSELYSLYLQGEQKLAVPAQVLDPDSPQQENKDGSNLSTQPTELLAALKALAVSEGSAAQAAGETHNEPVSSAPLAPPIADGASEEPVDEQSEVPAEQEEFARDITPEPTASLSVGIPEPLLEEAAPKVEGSSEDIEDSPAIAADYVPRGNSTPFLQRKIRTLQASISETNLTFSILSCFSEGNIRL